MSESPSSAAHPATVSSAVFARGGPETPVDNATVSRLVRQLEEAQEENERLRRELTARQFQAGEPSDFAREFVHVFGKVAEMTRQLFPDGPVTFEHAIDPENPADEWFVFDVFAKGEFKDYKATISHWHDEVDKIVPGTICEFRLSVMPLR